MEPTIYQKIREAVGVIEGRTKLRPQVGMILGSGLGSVADDVTDATIISYSEIPYFHGTSVEGHAGKLIVGNYQGVPTVMLQGRFHLYEGYPMEDVVFPTRTVCGMGIQSLIMTNAAGGINLNFKPKDIMIINDHINLMGDNPLKGPNLKELGPRFPDLTEAYNRGIVRILADAAKEAGVPTSEGVYVGLLGPTYETPAEIKMLRAIGADAVGMSTVAESIAANHLGVQVAGISCITNLAAGITQEKLTHDEVIENSKSCAVKLQKILKVAIPNLVKKK